MDRLGGVAGAMVGHAFPLLARFRGGKSVMCFVGGAFALVAARRARVRWPSAWRSPPPRFTYGARAGVFAFPLAQLVTDPVEHVAGTGALMCLHRRRCSSWA